LTNQPARAALEQLFRAFLDDEDAAEFIRQVAQRYTIGTLHRLLASGTASQRRAAALAVGFLGDFDSNDMLGAALRDDDRGVRLLAEQGIQQLWVRAASQRHQLALLEVVRLNNNAHYGRALRAASRLIRQAPRYAEAWNQRVVARFHLCEYLDCIADAHQVLELNPHHYGACVAMGQSYLEIDEPTVALETLRRALRLNPSLEGVRAQVLQLEQALEGR